MKFRTGIMTGLAITFSSLIMIGLCYSDDWETSTSGQITTQNPDSSVGIGTTSPKALLHVASDTDAYLAKFGDISALKNRVVIERTGNVGIGTMSPTALLHVASDTDTYLAKFGDISASQNRLVIKRTGNVGIGTTNPQAKLDVQGNTKISGNLNVQNIISDGDICIGNCN